ncbi:hypothetical protein pb186bvf_012476 [Paramecium bursaria]
MEKKKLTDFDPEQRYYLDMLVKFSGRTQRTTVSSSQSIPSKKYNFIKENLPLLSIDEQIEFNDLNRSQQQVQNVSLFLVGSGTLATFCYFIMTRPLQQKLYFEGAKSLGVGILVGMAFFQFNQYRYRESIHKFYVNLQARSKLGVV